MPEGFLEAYCSDEKTFLDFCDKHEITAEEAYEWLIDAADGEDAVNHAK
jgi:hypothetical protein